MPNVLETDQQVALQKVSEKPYALLQEAFRNELEVAKNCQLTHLLMKNKDGSKSESELDYSLAISKRTGDKFIPVIDQALKQVIDSGKVDELKRKYLNSDCEPFQLPKKENNTIVEN